MAKRWNCPLRLHSVANNQLNKKSKKDEQADQSEYIFSFPIHWNKHLYELLLLFFFPEKLRSFHSLYCEDCFWNKTQKSTNISSLQWVDMRKISCHQDNVRQADKETRDLFSYSNLLSCEEIVVMTGSPTHWHHKCMPSPSVTLICCATLYPSMRNFHS